MQFAKEDIARFIEVVIEDKGVDIQNIKKEVVSYIHNGDKRKHTKVNLHTLAVDALAKLSKEHNITVKIFNGVSIFKIGKFKLETPIKDWTNSIMFITLLKLKG